MTSPKKPGLAFLLSFILPGAGLCYLGKWWAGLANFLAVLALGCVCAICMPDDVFNRYAEYIAIGCAGGSAGLANAVALKQNGGHR